MTPEDRKILRLAIDLAIGYKEGIIVSSVKDIGCKELLTICKEHFSDSFYVEALGEQGLFKIWRLISWQQDVRCQQKKKEEAEIRIAAHNASKEKREQLALALIRKLKLDPETAAEMASFYISTNNTTIIEQMLIP